MSRTPRETQSSTTSMSSIARVVGADRRAPARRLQADETAAARGNADRSATVVRVRGRDHAARDRGGRPPARATGRARGVPRVAAGPVGLGLGGRDEPELRRVGAADAHEARVEVALRERLGVIVVPAGLLQEAHAFVQRVAFDPAHQILEEDRHAAKRAVGQLTLRGRAPSRTTYGSPRSARD